MKLILITPPRFRPDEAREIAALFRAGLETLHLRKPQASAAELEALLRRLPADCLPRIVLHDHFALCAAYRLKGVHLNSRNPLPPQGHAGSVSRSCHSLDEVRLHAPLCDYVFLSPVYDSISKEGYGAAFTPDVLRRARAEGLIYNKVYALGGVGLEQLPEVHALGFRGAAVLGDVWQREPQELVSHFEKLKQTADKLI